MVNKRMVTTQLDCDVKLKETTKMVDIKTSRIKVSCDSVLSVMIS